MPFWKLAIIESLIVGQDGVARAAIVKVVNSKGRTKLKCQTFVPVRD